MNPFVDPSRRRNYELTLSLTAAHMFYLSFLILFRFFFNLYLSLMKSYVLFNPKDQVSTNTFHSPTAYKYLCSLQSTSKLIGVL